MEDLEYSISQYVDGSLPAAEKAALEKRLAEDADARAMLEEYRKLDEAIRASATPMPEIDWDALAGRISNAVAEQNEANESFKIERVRRSPWVVRASWMALAASVLIVAGIAIHLMRPTPGTPIGDPGPLARNSSADIHGPQAEPATGPSVAEVTITAPAQFADASREYPNGEGIVVQPSRVTIASAVGGLTKD